MRIKQSRLYSIVKEQVLRRLHEISEAGGMPDEDELQSAKKGKPNPSFEEPLDAAKPVAAPDERPLGDVKAGEDERDDARSGDDKRGGRVNDIVSGHAVTAVSIEPRSKIVPGCKEVVFAFEGLAEPLRVIVTKTGGVKFHLRGIHNEP